MPKNQLLNRRKDQLYKNLSDLNAKGLSIPVLLHLQDEVDYASHEKDPKKQAYSIYYFVSRFKKYNQDHGLLDYDSLLNELMNEANQILGVTEKKAFDPAYVDSVLQRKCAECWKKQQVTIELGKNLVTLSPQDGRLANIDIRMSPQAMPLSNQNQWLSFGDMHGNAAKLNHIILMTGAAYFPHTRKIHYNNFVAIYHLTEEDWDRLNDEEAKYVLKKMDDTIDQLIMTGQVNLRLIGDLLSDRGSNDYFTLRLLEKLIEKDPSTIEIILSNHDLEAIRRHLNRFVQDFSKYSEQHAFSYRNKQSQTQSILGMHYLFKRGLISQDRVNHLFDQYFKVLKLGSYDKSSVENVLMLYFHAPVNPMDIFYAGLSLNDPENAFLTENWITEEQREALDKILRKVQTGASLVNGDLVVIIDALNEALKNALNLRSHIELLKLDIQTEYEITRPNEPPETMRFWDDDTIRLTRPMFILIESRDDPAATLKASNINTSECRVIVSHGHVGIDKKSYFENCLNTDTDTGKYVLRGFEAGPLPYLCTTALKPEEKQALVEQASAKNVVKPI